MFLIEIFALIFLCKRNGELALQKGLKSRNWKWYTVTAWIVTEFFGCILGLMMFGQADIKKMSQVNILQVSMVALFCAFGGYLFIRYNLEKKPDYFKEDMNHVSVDDLQPPPRQ
jgi:uncharacterized membrane protein